nr:rRNA 2'-O-methyltransferase fibrillarin-like [Aegilops tauschii subsp. strangulata]
MSWRGGSPELEEGATGGSGVGDGGAGVGGERTMGGGVRQRGRASERSGLGLAGGGDSEQWRRTRRSRGGAGLRRRGARARTGSGGGRRWARGGPTRARRAVVGGGRALPCGGV